MKSFIAALALSIALLPVACKDDHDHSHDGKGGHSNTKGGHSHEGTKHDLGEAKAGALTVKVIQIGEMKPGAEIMAEVTVTGAKPSVIRGWIGDDKGELAEGASKGKAEMHESDWDLHCMAPKTLTDGLKLWVEIEADGKTERASFTPKK